MNKSEIIQPEIRIKKVSIENFRGFENIELEFQSDITVLIGENGAGKTALLDCLALLLTILKECIQYQTFKAENFKEFFVPSDIRQKSAKTINRISLFLGNEELYWEAGLKRNFNNYALLLDEILPIESVIQQLFYERKTTENRINLPLIVYYPASNAPVNSIDFKNASDNFTTNIFSAYEGALDKKSFDFVNFFNWYKWQENIEKQIGENKTLDTVRDAIYNILSDEHNQFDKLSINWLNNPNGEMMICKGETPLNINQLSSGEKTLLTLVADLARRLAIANPHRENPLIGNGVILIDEVDLHLHPRWQRALVPQLQKTFPNCQFIVTTHSPLVLSNISHKKVIILEDFQPVKITPHTFGRDNNSILYELMGVKQRPDEMQQQFDKVYELIDDDHLKKAEKLLTQLSEVVGSNDPDIVYGNSLINFMDDE
jgi:predicted ATP-binding protein involved in virulence